MGLSELTVQRTSALGWVFSLAVKMPESKTKVAGLSSWLLLLTPTSTTADQGRQWSELTKLGSCHPGRKRGLGSQLLWVQCKLLYLGIKSTNSLFFFFSNTHTPTHYHHHHQYHHQVSSRISFRNILRSSK